MDMDGEDEINTTTIDEFKMPKDAVQEAQATWQKWIMKNTDEETAGLCIFEAVFQSMPALQGLFDTTTPAQAGKFMKAFTECLQGALSREELKLKIETLGFLHMNIEVTTANTVLFKNAMITCMDKDLQSAFSVSAREVISKLVLYIGGAFIVIRKSSSKRRELLMSSWKQSHSGDKDAKKDHFAEEDEEEEANAEKKDGENEGEEEKNGEAVEDIEQQSQSSDDSTSKKKLKQNQQTLPTSFNEMFQINAAVMGFQRAASTWMADILDVLDQLVSNLTSTKRLQEENCMMVLRLAMHPKDQLNLGQFKACLLAALRSTLPKDWTTAHEDAWSWLWDNIVRITEQNLDLPRQYETALEDTLKSFSSKRLFKLRKDIYSKFFALAPAGENFFKQSNTRLHFIADRVLEMTLEMFKDPQAMISNISALGLRHVGYGIPTELFVPFCTACVLVLQKFNPTNDLANKSFQWSLLLTANVLTRTIKEGSTVVMKAINLNSIKAVQKAVSAAPRGERATWLLHIQVGDQFISPLVWALDSGSLHVVEGMINELLTIRADRARYYYGVDELFLRHPDIVQRLADKAPDLLRPLLDGLIWRSHRTFDNGQKRRVNYYVKHMLIDAKGKYCDAMKSISSTGDPKIVSHPVLALLVEVMWRSIVRKQFMYSRLWNIISLIIFVTAQELLPNEVKNYGGDTARKLEIALLAVRIFSYVIGIGRLGLLQLNRAWIWSRTTFRKILAEIDTDGNGEIDYEEMKEAVFRFKDTVKGEMRKALKILRDDDDDISAFAEKKAAAANKQSKMYNRISFAVMVLLTAMITQEPMIVCQDAPTWPTTTCPEATPDLIYRYSVLGMIAMVVHYMMLIDLAVFSTEISAFLLVVSSVLGEMTQFLTALTFLLLLFGSTISILCRNCPIGGGDFNDMPNAIISLFAMTIGLYQGDYRDIQLDGGLLFCVYTYVIFAVVLLLNLLIAQLNRTYEYIYQDMLGFAQLNRASLIVDAMQSCPKARWEAFVKQQDFDTRREFDEGDLGLAGCIQIVEPATLNRVSQEQIKRYGGTTARSMPWPQERKRKADFDDDHLRMEFIEEVLQKTVSRMDRLARRRGLATSGDGGSGMGSMSGSSISEGSDGSDIGSNDSLIGSVSSQD